MIYLITYDKALPLKDYKPLEAAIKNISPNWWHHMASTWLVRTNLTATEVYNLIHSHISQADKLLVIEIQENYQGWLKEEAWVWIQTQFERDNQNYGNPY